jgi:hypothetical protein
MQKILIKMKNFGSKQVLQLKQEENLKKIEKDLTH